MPDRQGPYTHGHHESVLRSHRWRTADNSAAYLLDRLRAGSDVLDIGCGPGTITVDLARLVEPGLVIGIDRAEAVLADARRTAAERGAGNVDFRVGDAYRLEFDAGAFDVVHAHQVLQHLSDPVAALVEMRRVCRRAGIVAARDADYQAMTWFPGDAGLERWLEMYRGVARANGGEPDAGRQLLSWAQRAGFSEVVPSASVWCFATPYDRAWWGGLWAERVTHSALGEQAVESGRATRRQLLEIAMAWNRWAASDDGWFAVIHGEVLCRP